MDSLRSGLGYEHSNEPSGTMKVGEIIRQLGHYQLYNNDSLFRKLSKIDGALRELEFS
jgi:hypothetical protein